MDSKKRNIIIVAVAAVVAVVIAGVTVAFVFLGNNGNGGIIIGNKEVHTTKYDRVEYEPDEYEPDICGNCEERIPKGAKSYYPSDEFMIYVTQDLEKEDIAICERCAKENVYRAEIAEGKSIEEYLRK